MLTETREGKLKRRTIVVVSGRIPLSPNKVSRAFWKVRADEVKLWAWEIGSLLNTSERQALRKNMAKPKPSLVTIRVLFFHRRKVFDPGNSVSALKFIIDGMVRAGLLEDDTDKHVEILTPLQWAGCGPATILSLTWSG